MNWTPFDEEDFKRHYWQEVAPDMEEDGLDPGEPPTIGWMRNRGHSAYRQAVERHLGVTFMEFCRRSLGISRGSGHVYDLDVEHPRTRELIYRWAESHLLERMDRDEETVRRVLYNLNAVTSTLRDQEGHDNLVVLGSDETPKSESFEVFLGVFDELRNQYEHKTVSNFLNRTKLFYDYLLNRHNPVEYNPVGDLRTEYTWNLETGDPPALSPDQLRALASVAESLEEKTIVVLYCAIGLRRSEAAKVHTGLLEFDPETLETPVINFDSRKNGPSTVNIVYGADVLQERITQLENDYGDDWNGYLFPTPHRFRDHLTDDMVARTFDSLVDRAARETDVDMTLEDGSRPTPQTARRFWYNQYTKGASALLGVVNQIAGEQGSKDPEVVLNNYLSDRRRLTILREHMADTLADAFAGTEIGRSAPDRDVIDVDDVLEGDLNEQRDPFDRDRGGSVETPVDRFLAENTTEDTSDADGWLSNVVSDESGILTSGGAVKAAVLATALSLATQAPALV